MRLVAILAYPVMHSPLGFLYKRINFTYIPIYKYVINNMTEGALDMTLYC